MVKTGVIHGRFQVFHKDHLKYILAGKSRCSHLVVGITNPDPLLTGKDPADPHRSTPLSNPLTYFERYVMIRETLVEAGLGWTDFSVVPFPVNFPELYKYYVPLDAVFFLTIYDEWGRRKLEWFRGQGLATEILWTRSSADKGLSAGYIRRLMAEGAQWTHLVPAAATRRLVEWDIPERLKRLFDAARQDGI